MAYDDSKMELLVLGNIMSIYGYTTTDAAAVVDTAGYFNAKADELKVGDRIHLNVDTDGTPGYGIAVVTSNTGGVVDIADMVDLAGTDTD